MKKNYPYLKDVDFLNKIYGLHSQTMYTNITVLKWDETPIQEVTGRVVSASISVNGDSSVRRTANLTVKIKNNNELFTNIDSLFSINKKVFIELGLINEETLFLLANWSFSSISSCLLFSVTSLVVSTSLKFLQGNIDFFSIYKSHP